MWRSARYGGEGQFEGSSSSNFVRFHSWHTAKCNLSYMHLSSHMYAPSWQLYIKCITASVQSPLNAPMYPYMYRVVTACAPRLNCVREFITRVWGIRCARNWLMWSQLEIFSSSVHLQLSDICSTLEYQMTQKVQWSYLKRPSFLAQQTNILKA